MVKLDTDYNIRAIHVRYEFEIPNEYGVFSSSKIPANIGHIFTVTKDLDGINIKQGSTVFDQL